MAKIILRDINMSFPVIGSDVYLKGALVNKLIGGKINKNEKKVSVKALNNISLEINNGDRIGLIGHNGAGKSTLLSLIAGIYHPDSGVRSVDGKVQTLFDTNIGLEPEESGLKNIRKIALFHGVQPGLVEEKLDKIIEESGLGNYINFPVRTYSSGMRLRLGFCVISSLKPEILVLDEMIGVGDKNFQDYAQNKINNLISSASILVIATHSNKIIEKFCNRLVLMKNGKIIKDGSVEEVNKYYQNHDLY